MPELRIDRDIVYSEPNGVSLTLDVYRPAEGTALPVILLVHGGGWCRGTRQDMDWVARFLADQGYLVGMNSYRLAPAFPYPAACEDIQAAAAWLIAHAAEYGGDPARLGAFGISAGAHLVAWLATMPGTPLVCCAEWAGPMDMRREPVTYPFRSFGLAFMGACQHDAPEAYEEASPLLRLTADTPPLLLIHGTADGTVPVAHAHYMFEAARELNVPVSAVILDGVTHTAGRPDDPATAPGWDALVRFFAEHLCGVREQL
jgi:acetyl esterase/lipase